MTRFREYSTHHYGAYFRRPLGIMKIKIDNRPQYKTKNTLSIALNINQQLAEIDYGNQFVDLLSEYDLFPDKYRAGLENKKKHFEKTNANEILHNIWPPTYTGVWSLNWLYFYRSKKPKYEMSIFRSWILDHQRHLTNVKTRHTTLFFDIETDAMKVDLGKRVLDFIRVLTIFFRTDLARIQHFTAQEVWESSGGREPKIVGQIEKNLIDLDNIDIWGKPYIDFFGKEKLLNCPCYKTEELPSGAIWTQLSPDIFSEKGCWTALKDIRARVKSYLNNNAFYDPALPHDHKYNVPKFDLSDIKPIYRDVSK